MSSKFLNFLVKNIMQILCSVGDDSNHIELFRVPVVPPSYAEMLHDISLQHVNVGQNPDESASPSEPEDDFFDDGDQRAFDPSVEYYPQPYCSIVNSFSETCFSDSILELFSKNGNLEEGTFDVLSQDDIIQKLNGDMIRCVKSMF